VTTILLARHGESDWNRDGRWQGQADRPLTDRGLAQARSLADRLSEIELDAVYASDLRRARDTADIVARARRLEVHTLPGLREVDVGSWSGLTREQVQRRFPDAYRRWTAGDEGWDEGETYEQMSARVVSAILELAANHAGGRVLVVAHGGSIRAVHAAALGLDILAYRRVQRVEPNATLSAVRVEQGRPTQLLQDADFEGFLAEDRLRRRAPAG
jgi:broad specificity phosphatase PhoE